MSHQISLWLLLKNRSLLTLFFLLFTFSPKAPAEQWAPLPSMTGFAVVTIGYH